MFASCENVLLQSKRVFFLFLFEGDLNFASETSRSAFIKSLHVDFCVNVLDVTQTQNLFEILYFEDLSKQLIIFPLLISSFIMFYI